MRSINHFQTKEEAMDYVDEKFTQILVLNGIEPNKSDEDVKKQMKKKKIAIIRTENSKTKDINYTIYKKAKKSLNLVEIRIFSPTEQNPQYKVEVDVK